MPTIYPPKLREIYANTFFTPSSIVTNVPTSNYVMASDGNGTTRWVAQSGGGGPATIPPDLNLSTLFAVDTISTSSTFTDYISAGIGFITYLSTQEIWVSSINGLPPGSGGIASIPPVLNLSTLYVADTISSISTFTDYISAGIGVFNYLSTQDFYVSSINGQTPGGLTEIPANLNLSTLYVADTISSISTFTDYISAGIGLFNFISTSDVYISSINNQQILTQAELTSTVEGLGTANYISSTQLTSTVEGLGTANYISSTQLTSTVEGLGTANYISSTQLTSTVEGLGTANYISSTQLTSTIEGLGTANYISSTQLTSTVTGINTNITSTVTGLGTANYISSTQLTSTVTGLGTANYISSTQLTSTVAGLGTAGYISSQQLASTVLGLPSLRFGPDQTDNTGIKTITFSPAFTTTPSVYVTPQGFAVLAVTNIATTGADVLSFNPTNGLAQGAVTFQWQAIGFM